MKAMNEEHLAILRRHMVDVIGIHFDLAEEEIGKSKLDDRVAAAILRVRRHLFVPLPLAAVAYQDTPLPIGFDKTVSQPFISARMTALLEIEPQHAVLEVGTGLGYHAAVLAELAQKVWTVEVVEEFASHAETRLRQLGYGNVAVRVGDGSKGWAEHAPFVMPLGPEEAQLLTVVSKNVSGRIEEREVMPVRFSRLETVV
jgi:protein-L-isoaspartate(D-aspartate) O-methyltransferase